MLTAVKGTVFKLFSLGQGIEVKSFGLQQGIILVLGKLITVAIERSCTVKEFLELNTKSRVGRNI